VANLVQWQDATSQTVVNIATVLNDGSGTIGSQYTNSTNLHRWAAFELEFGLTSTNATGAIELYLVYKLDGTNYEEGDASTKPPANRLVATFIPSASTPTRTMASGPVMLLPFDLKPVIYNESGQNITTNTLQLDIHPFDEEIQ
jgi:hypothetical protein